MADRTQQDFVWVKLKEKLRAPGLVKRGNTLVEEMMDKPVGKAQIIAGPRKYNFDPGVPQKFPRAEFEALLESYQFLEICPAPAATKGPKEK